MMLERWSHSKTFLQIEGEFLFSLLSEPRSLKCRNGKGGIIIRKVVRLVPDFTSGSTGAAAAPTRNY